MVKVCDAIMGSGKTSATISLFNSYPDKKYIYITPYLDEANRIKEACPELNFIEPSNKLPEYNMSKYAHTMHLLEEGRNITSTHKMFTMYTPETLELIKSQKYTLVVDEAVELFKDAKMSTGDFKILKELGWLSENGVYTHKDPTSYAGGKMNEYINLARSNRLLQLTKKNGERLAKFYFWELSKELFEAFDDIYVLTYLFEHQTMKYYFDLNKIPFKYIGISHPSSGEYYFSDKIDYIPEYVKELRDKIHIFENEKLNSIGDDRCALSSGWTDKAMSDPDRKPIRQLSKNIRNFFRNYHGDIPANERLWSVFSKAEPFVGDKGFLNSNLAFNTKATNDFRHKTILAYCVNIFMQTCVKQHFYSNGVHVNEDRYAISIMVQWIWRSAIRDGKDIWIYIPSKRMRDLLKTWINETEELYYRINKRSDENIE